MIAYNAMAAAADDDAFAFTANGLGNGISGEFMERTFSLAWSKVKKPPFLPTFFG